MAYAPQKILLVDDDSALRDALVFSLGLEGFAVEAFDSAEALSERGGLDEDGCLVVDHRLPGLDGLSLLRQLRKLNVMMPALLITSHPNASLRRGAAELGVPIVEKPLLSNTLLTSIREAIRTSGRPAGTPLTYNSEAPAAGMGVPESEEPPGGKANGNTREEGRGVAAGPLVR